MPSPTPGALLMPKPSGAENRASIVVNSSHARKPGLADRTNNRPKQGGSEVRLIDGALAGSHQRHPLSRLRMWRWTLETESSPETAVSWVAVAAWPQAIVCYGSLSWCRAAGSPMLSGGALGLAVVAASRTRMCSRIVAMTSGFSMQAMMRSVPGCRSRHRRCARWNLRNRSRSVAARRVNGALFTDDNAPARYCLKIWRRLRLRWWLKCRP